MLSITITRSLPRPWTPLACRLDNLQVPIVTCCTQLHTQRGWQLHMDYGGGGDTVLTSDVGYVQYRSEWGRSWTSAQMFEIDGA
jgi:hypothetical protein